MYLILFLFGSALDLRTKKTQNNGLCKRQKNDIDGSGPVINHALNLKER